MFVWQVCNETVIMLVCKPLTSHYSRVPLNRVNVVMMLSAQKSRHSLADWSPSPFLHTWWLCCFIRSSIPYLTRQTLESFLSCRTVDPSSLSFPFSSLDRGLTSQLVETRPRRELRPRSSISSSESSVTLDSFCTKKRSLHISRWPHVFVDFYSMKRGI